MERKGIEVQAVFDIETSEWDQFVVGAILWADGTYREFWWRSEEELAKAILLTPGAVWAHNGGLFDAKWLMDLCLKLDVPFVARRAGGRVVALEAGACTVYDSFALSHVKLSDLSAGLAEHKIETGLPCKCGEDCGGYCAIRRDMPAELRRKLSLYLRRDCEALLASLVRLEEWAASATVDLDLRATVGSSAYRTAKRSLELPDAALSWSDHAFARRAYFGGRVHVFRPLSELCQEYDVVQMYPWALSQTWLPWGEPERVYARQAARAYESDRCAIVFARVDVPDCHVPPLPVRADDRIWYPTGRFQGTWTAAELRYAEHLGVEVEPIQALVWEERRRPFAGWIDRLHELRVGAPGGKGGPLGTFCKFVANSMIGKFGTKPRGQVVEADPEDVKPCTCGPGARCSGECGAHVAINEDFRIYSKTTLRLGPECHVEWAAHCLTTARIEWHRQAISGGNGGFDLCYCDTDSLYCEAPRTRRIGSKFGNWEHKGPAHHFEALAPKLYKYDRDDRLVVKSKGVTAPKISKDDPLADDRRADFWAALCAGADIPRVGIWGLSRGAKAGQFFRKETGARSAKQGFGDRILEAGSKYTRACTIEEVRALTT